LTSPFRTNRVKVVRGKTQKAYLRGGLRRHRALRYAGAKRGKIVEPVAAKKRERVGRVLVQGPQIVPKRRTSAGMQGHHQRRKGKQGQGRIGGGTQKRGGRRIIATCLAPSVAITLRWAKQEFGRALNV